MRQLLPGETVCRKGPIPSRHTLQSVPVASFGRELGPRAAGRVAAEIRFGLRLARLVRLVAREIASSLVQLLTCLGDVLTRLGHVLGLVLLNLVDVLDRFLVRAGDVLRSLLLRLAELLLCLLQ